MQHIKRWHWLLALAVAVVGAAGTWYGVVASRGQDSRVPATTRASLTATTATRKPAWTVERSSSRATVNVTIRETSLVPDDTKAAGWDWWRVDDNTVVLAPEWQCELRFDSPTEVYSADGNYERGSDVIFNIRGPSLKVLIGSDRKPISGHFEVTGSSAFRISQFEMPRKVQLRARRTNGDWSDWSGEAALTSASPSLSVEWTVQ